MNAVLLIDFTVKPPLVKRILPLAVPMMGRKWRVDQEARIYSNFPGLAAQLETFRATPEAFEVWKDDDAA